jgi:UDP-3-O-[3-hydroxymyristoyl] glucosamine N-acyltransferase
MCGKHAYISPKATIGKNIYAGEFAVISDNANIGNNVKIYPQVFIGENVTIGDNTTLFAGVKIYSDCVIGKDCIIHSGTVIGSDGFRFAPEVEGNKKIAQIGNVVIEDDVEIGANCAIDRATLGSTILRKGVKFDNLIHIAHNVEIGENSYLAACNVVAGSTKIGKNCMLMYDLYPPIFINDAPQKKEYIATLANSFKALLNHPNKWNDYTEQFFEQELDRILTNASLLYESINLIGKDREKKLYTK